MSKFTEVTAVTNPSGSYRKRVPSLPVMLVLSSLLGGIIALGLFATFYDGNLTQ